MSRFGFFLVASMWLALSCGNNRSSQHPGLKEDVPTQQAPLSIQELLVLRMHTSTDTRFAFEEGQPKDTIDVDALLLDKLRENNLFVDNRGHDVFLYYHSLVNVGFGSFMSAVFKKVTVTSCGEDALIYTTFNGDGNIIDALTIAFDMSPAECQMSIASTIVDDTITSIYMEHCYSEPDTVYHTVTNKYEIAESGQIRHIFSSDSTFHAMLDEDEQKVLRMGGK